MAARMVPAGDVGSWSRFHPNHKHPLWWGIFGLIAIETTVVGSLLVSYFYLRMLQPAWPPAGVAVPDLLIPSVNLGLLLLSAAAMYGSNVAVSRGSRPWTVAALTAALLLDGAVLVLRWRQLSSLDFGWRDHAYGSIFWTIEGFHFLHVASAIVGTLVVWYLALAGYWTKERQLGSTIDAIYWYFVSLIWIPMYLTLYWAPRVLP